MAWTVKRGIRAVKAMLDEEDRTWIRVRDVADMFGVQLTVDEKSHTIEFVDRPQPVAPIPLPADPAGADVQPWLPVNAPVLSDPGQRSPVALDAVIRQFRVAQNPRYAPNRQGQGETYCNIFLWDVTRALGCEVPHWVTEDGAPALAGQGRELDANGVILWLANKGSVHGWRVSGQAEAVAAAQVGLPAAVGWYADAPPAIGHVAVLRAAQPDSYRGAAIAQAGGRNFDDGFLLDGFGGRRPLQWWVHD